MPDAGTGAGMSRYNAVKLVLVSQNTSPDVWVSVSAKPHAGGWADYSRLMPSFRVAREEPVNNSLEALRLLRSALDEAIAIMEEAPH